ncbi:Myosin-16 [Orchesella cincta]|uniref:Myosin-16 n=1 Tax=Orchesella cincta TaxID=48709 RepID=A0A1D2MJX5_ORCCI|nr:Myosin-16 [Orchesella cincta]
MTTELESARAQHQRQEHLESQLNELQSTNVSLTSSLEDLERELKNQRETCAKQTRYIEDQLALITSMNKIAEEHEQCRDLGGRLKFAEEQVANLTKSKKVLQQQHLESQQGTFSRIKVAEDQVGKLMTNNVALQHQLKAYQDMAAKLNSAQDQVEMLIVEKVALEQELKKHQDASEKAARGVVITRATQCSDLSTEIDHYRDASKHYRARAHNAEFELERTKKALEEIESEYHGVMRQGASQEPANNQGQMKVNDGEAVTMVNRGLQCTLLNELLQRPKGNEGETRLVGLPGVATPV